MIRIAFATAALCSMVGWIPTASAAEPASAYEAKAALDLSQIVFPKGFEVGQATVGTLFATGPGSVAALADDLSRQLRKLGCTDDKAGPPSQRTEDYASHPFRKGDFAVFLSVSRSDKSVTVSINNLGNIDVSTLPVPKGTKTTFKNRGTHLFIHEGSVAEAGKQVDALLTQAGWRRYRDVDGSSPPETEFLQWNYMKRGVTLSVYVSKAPAQGNKTSVQYGASMLNNDFIVPEDVEAFDLSDFPTLEFKYKTKKTLAETMDFYLAELPKYGWKQRTDRGYRKDTEKSLLVFERPKEALFIWATPIETGTDIHGEQVPPSLLEEPEKNVAKEEMKEELPSVVITLPKGAQNVEWSADSSEVKFKTKLSPGEVVKFYSKAWKADGWEEEKLGRAITEFGGATEFEKDKASLSLHLFKDVFEGKTDVTVSGSLILLKQK